MNQLDINSSLLKFDKSRRRVKNCPCGGSNRDGKFAPYVGYTDKGYCHSCGQSFLPELSEGEDWRKPAIQRKPVIRPVSFIEEKILAKTLSCYEHNNFAAYLESIFGKGVANQLLEKYCVGTSKKWYGATVFWQKDTQGYIRTGKIMLYNPVTGKRIREPRAFFSYVHTELKMAELNFKQCFFGEHLLKDETKPIAIAESEKTAVVASQYLPQFIWIACGGSGGLTNEKCKILAGRDVFLYPDLSKTDAKVNCFESWSGKAEELNRVMPGTLFQVSSLLENKATPEERQQGLDLADYLVRFNYQSFRQLEAMFRGSSIYTKTETIPEPFSIDSIKQARFDELKNKYPNLNILAERLGLEVFG